MSEDRTAFQIEARRRHPSNLSGETMIDFRKNPN